VEVKRPFNTHVPHLRLTCSLDRWKAEAINEHHLFGVDSLAAVHIVARNELGHTLAFAPVELFELFIPAPVKLLLRLQRTHEMECYKALRRFADGSPGVAALGDEVANELNAVIVWRVGGEMRSDGVHSRISTG